MEKGIRKQHTGGLGDRAALTSACTFRGLPQEARRAWVQQKTRWHFTELGLSSAGQENRLGSHALESKWLMDAV